MQEATATLRIRATKESSGVLEARPRVGCWWLGSQAKAGPRGGPGELGSLRKCPDQKTLPAARRKRAAGVSLRERGSQQEATSPFSLCQPLQSPSGAPFRQSPTGSRGESPNWVMLG